MDREYMSGFGNEFATEAKENTLPIGQNSPQEIAHGLYAEQINATAFTKPRAQNKRSWTYRIRPSAMHEPFELIEHKTLRSSPFNELPATPNQLRWSPLDAPQEKINLIDSLVTIAGGGDTASWAGLGIHLYAANTSMDKDYFYNSDGEMLFVPQDGALTLRTEMGILDIKPGEIAVIPRGIKFAVNLINDTAKGYICENYGASFIIPDLGPIGANGLANPRDFLTPTAAYEDIEGDFNLTTKFNGSLWQAKMTHSPLDVVAWHGNLAPYKYDLDNFNAVNSVTFDHPDPSIFTVLTSPSGDAGTANIDFVIFPPRWYVADNTFRPPYYHRNIMSEFMGLIKGIYDGKEGGGFVEGGSSLHNCMTAHGPDAKVFEKASNADLKPQYIGGTLAFMFESRFLMAPTKHAMETDKLQKNYYKCWQGLKKNFKK